MNRPARIVSRASAVTERTRMTSAWHESGHGLMAWLNGERVALLSIRPTAVYGGVCQAAHRRIDVKLLDCRPVILQPARLRRSLETALFFSLAGPIAAEMCAPRTGYLQQSADEGRAEQVARALARLHPSTAERLRVAEARTDAIQTDEDTAFIYADALAFDEAVQYLAWARAATRRLLAEHADELAAVATALYARDVISGRQMVAAIRATKGPH